MAGYRQSNPDRAKAAAATLLIHIAIGAAFLTGLVTNVARPPTEVMQTFDVEPPPPPVVEVKKEEPAPRGDPGEAGKKAQPTPVAVPEPKIEVPAKPPIIAAPVPGQGVAPSAGAAQAGAGTGAGGRGSGLGGGGSGGNGAGFTPPQQIRRIPDREYRRISASGIRNGSAALRLVVSPEGRAISCRVVRSSGDASVDALVCQLTQRYARYRPARDAAGEPVPWELTWQPYWYSTR
jgi:protein TonB